jgi:hypothetical protein
MGITTNSHNPSHAIQVTLLATKIRIPLRPFNWLPEAEAGSRIQTAL